METDKPIPVYQLCVKYNYKENGISSRTFLIHLHKIYSMNRKNFKEIFHCT